MGRLTNKTHFRLHVRIIPDYMYASDSTAHYRLTGVPATQFTYRLVNSLPGNNYIRPSRAFAVNVCRFCPSVVTRNDKVRLIRELIHDRARGCARTGEKAHFVTRTISRGEASSFFRFAMFRGDMTRIRRPAYHLFGGLASNATRQLVARFRLRVRFLSLSPTDATGGKGTGERSNFANYSSVESKIAPVLFLLLPIRDTYELGGSIFRSLDVSAPKGPHVCPSVRCACIHASASNVARGS